MIIMKEEHDRTLRLAVSRGETALTAKIVREDEMVGGE
jgi:hypothetical protein